MNQTAINELDWGKGDGLLPAIVQDADSGSVLMLGYQNRDALAETFARGRVVFFSRSRQTLWEKGETSGNTLHLVDARPDCDGDTLLIRARPAGPTCHTGAPACFADAEPPLAILTELERTVDKRAAANDPSESYTARLLAKGPRRIAQKVGEEGVETALAAVGGSDEELANESADLLYHLIVLLRARGLRLTDAAAVLAARRQ
jgi:phosphoribosyl-ATP pyrophosphohydrolase/phosphoribosyl-AMP cyclohydrolase